MKQAEIEIAKSFTIDARACDEHVSRNEMRINRIPVDVVLIPILLFMFTKKGGKCVYLRLECDDKQTVALLQHSRSIRKNHFSLAPNA